MSEADNSINDESNVILSILLVLFKNKSDFIGIECNEEMNTVQITSNVVITKEEIISCLTNGELRNISVVSTVSVKCNEDNHVLEIQCSHQTITQNIIKNYTMRGIEITLQHLFDGSMSKRITLYQLESLLQSIHILHCTITITLSQNQQRCLELNYFSTYTEAYEHTFHVRVNNMKSLYPCHSVLIEGCYCPIEFVPSLSSSSQTIILFNSHPIHNETLLQKLKLLYLKFMKLPQSTQFYPPVFIHFYSFHNSIDVC